MLKAVGCHVYAGGFAVGIERAGFVVLCHLEGDGGYGVDSARLNWPDRNFYFGPSNWPLRELRDRDIDFLFCNPPCALFSVDGISTSRGPNAWRSDPRLGCWHDCFNALEEVNPRAWCIESVPQAYSRGREVIDEFTKRALMRGYSVSHVLLSAHWMGLAQKRKRFFIVAHRPPKLVGYALNWAPAPTCGEVLDEITEPGRVSKMDQRYAEAVRSCPPGGRLKDSWEKLNPGFDLNRDHLGHVIGRPRRLVCRLDSDVQMGAYIGDIYLHPKQDRWLGINEAKALCGYPEDFQLAPPENGWASLLARTVMPPVGAWLGRAVAATLETPDAEWSERRVTVIDVREPDRQEVDLTDRYLDDSGRVRLRLRASGQIDYTGLRDEPKRPKVKSPIAEVVSDLKIAREHPRVGAGTVITPVGDEFVVRDIEALPRANHKEGSGDFIKRLLRETRLNAGEIVVAVHRSFANRRTRLSDVEFNRGQLKKEGIAIQRFVVTDKHVSIPTSPRSTGNTTKHIASPFISRGVGPLIAFTGCTGVQAKPRAHQQIGQRNDFPMHIARGLDELGLNVDWRPNERGEARSFDAVVAFLAPINGLTGVRRSFQLLVLLAQAKARGVPVVVFYDDWTVDIIHKGLLGAAGPGYHVYFRKRWSTYGKDVIADDIDRHADEVKDIAASLGGTWPAHWVGAYPAYGWGDPKIMEDLSGASRLIRIDPTPVSVDLDYRVDVEKERRWILAAINPYREWVEERRPTWPIFWTGRKEYGPKLATEDDVLRETARSRGIFAPPYHAKIDGTGWYRLRYVYSALTSGVLLTDPADARELGPAYQLTAQDIERCDDHELDGLAAAQRRHLLEGGLVSTTRERWLADLNKIAEVLR